MASHGVDGTLGIVGFKPSDRLAQPVFTTANVATVQAHATTGTFGTVLSFADGTNVTVFGVPPNGLQITT